jgi:Capsule polysaccharide biosynthesis protein
MNIGTFINKLSSLLDEDWVILAKKHPLETVRPVTGVTFVNDDTHVKDLLELCDAVLLINSGVGLNSMMWFKPVLYVGDTFYGFEGINKKVTTPEEANKVLKDLFVVDEEKVLRFIYYLINEFYSFGKAHTEIVPQNDGSTISRTVRIDFYKINIPNSYTRKYAYRDKTEISLSAPIYSRYFAYFEKKNKKKNEDSLKKSLEIIPIKPVEIKPIVNKPVVNKPKPKKKEAFFIWAPRQLFKLILHPKKFARQFKRWIKIKSRSI